MERAEYKLEFKATMYFVIKDDFEEDVWDGSRITFHKSGLALANKGFIVYQMDTLSHIEAKKEGTKKVNSFIDYLMIASNGDNVGPVAFAESPKLLNSDKFKGMPMTMEKKFTFDAGTLVAVFQKQWAESANSLSSKIRRLSNEKQAAIDRCLFWLRKGAENTDSNERFIYRWISVEALSGFLEKTPGSTKVLLNSLFNRLKNESAKTIFNKHRELVRQLEAASLEGWKGQKYSLELKGAIDAIERNGKYKVVMMKAVHCISEVRNRLLHRGESTSLVEGCNTLLRELIYALLKDLL